MTTQLKGKWRFEFSEGFDEYMKALGVNFALRKISGVLKPQEEIRTEAGYWFLDIYSTFKNIHLKFKLGEEFDESTGDGRQVKSTFTIEDGKLVHVQKGKPTENSTITREVNDEGDTLTVTLVADESGVTCVRKFKRIVEK